MLLVESPQPSGPDRDTEATVAYRFELVSRDGEVFETFETSEQRWQAATW